MKTAKLLLVEDDPVLARLIPTQMTKYGYRIVASTDNGEEGVQLAAKLSPDLVLMDVDLKGVMDGITAGTAIQQAQNIPILFLTSHAESERLTQARYSKPFSCLLKPVSARELALSIELSLSRHSSECEIRRLTQQLKQSEQA